MPPAKNEPEAKEEANPIKWWSYDANGSGEELLASKEVTGYKPTACFKVDYAKYCELLSIKPHPCVVARVRRRRAAGRRRVRRRRPLAARAAAARARPRAPPRRAPPHAPARRA